ncbi:MAG: hypothetical protein QXW86_08900, partial [Saccharolobus sp.]
TVLNKKIDENIVKILENDMINLLYAFSDNNGNICLGAYGIDKLEEYVYGDLGVFDSLINLTLNYIIDNRAKSEKGIENIINILQEVKSTKEEFRKNSSLKFYGKIRQSSIISPVNKDEEFYVELAPWVVKILFPFPITDPIVNPNIKNHEELLKVLKNYYRSDKRLLVDIDSLNKELLENKDIENNHFYIIPLYGSLDFKEEDVKKDFQKICEKITSTGKDVTKEKPSIVHFIMSSRNSQIDGKIISYLVENCISKNPLLDFLYHSSYLILHTTEDEMLNDFIRSYFISIAEGKLNHDEITTQKIEYYKIVLKGYINSLIDKSKRRGKTSLIIDDRCTHDIVNVMIRVPSSSPRTKLSTLLPLVYRNPDIKDVLVDLRIIFGENSKRIIDAETLPTVYREGVEPKIDNKSCCSIKDWMEGEDAKEFLFAAVHEISETISETMFDPLNDRVLEMIFNNPPLFKYFEELYLENAQIVIPPNVSMNKEKLYMYIYSMVLYYYYILNGSTQKTSSNLKNINSIRTEIKTILDEFLSRSEKLIKNIENLYESINKSINNINDTKVDTKDCFDIASPEDENHSLKDELEVLRKLLQYINDKLKDIENLNQVDYLNLVFLSSVGEGSKKLSLNSLNDSLEEIQNKLNDLNNVLSSLSNDLEQLHKYGIKLHEKICLKIPYSKKKKEREVQIDDVVEQLQKLESDIIKKLLYELKSREDYIKNIKSNVNHIIELWGDIR